MEPLTKSLNYDNSLETYKPAVSDENIRGRIIIFSTCMNISPGKLINKQISFES